MRVLPFFPAPALSDEELAAPLAPGEWAQALAQPAFRLRGLLIVLLLAVVVGMAIPPFFLYIQQRPGTLLPDPLLALLPCHNVATAVFILMYGASVLGMGWLGRHPVLLLRGLWAYLLLTLLRMGTIWLLPLVPPLDLVAMPDPFMSLIFHVPVEGAVTKDLFFSGHTSTVALLALAVRGRWWRGGLAVLAVLVGLLVLVQRVHYSYDVLAAPFFAWLAYWAAGFITKPVAGSAD